MMTMVWTVKKNVIGQYFESFTCAGLDKSISCVLFWALTGCRPLKGRYHSLSVKYIYAISKYNEVCPALLITAWKLALM